MTYVVDGFMKFTVRDHWETGIDLTTQMDTPVSACFKGETQLEVMEKICEFFNVDISALEFDQDDPGRIEIGRVEDKYGLTPTDRELEAWKHGNEKFEIWLAQYTGYLEKREVVEWDPQNEKGE